MTQRLSKALLAFVLVAAAPVPATAQGTAASPILHEEAKLLASDGGPDDNFGQSVAISGERLVVGAFRDDDLGVNSGSAYVFERDDTGQAARLRPPHFPVVHPSADLGLPRRALCASIN